MPTPSPAALFPATLSPARVKLERALEAQAGRTAVSLVKSRARAYLDQRGDLDAIAPGLSGAEPATLIAVGADLLALERRQPRRWFGFGSEAPAINARAMILLGRTLRRFCRA